MDPSTAVSPWKPSALVSASAGLHAGAAVFALARPSLWPWLVGGVLADQLLLAAAGLWPRSHWLGPNWTSLPHSAASRNQVAITIDDGPDPQVTPAVLDLLERHAAKATFFCIGERVQRYAGLTREIVRRGHSVENHSQHHPNYFSMLGPAAMAREVEQGQQTIETVTGQRPRFFRAPIGLRNPFLDPVLHRIGLRLASWTRRGFDTVRRDADEIVGRLTRDARGGDILLLHDGHSARTRSGAPVILEVLPQLLATLSTARLIPVTLRATLTEAHTP
jgi:peptidoglycan/xylan/chitin deacetylase (PgdA/CDA1 family)